MHNPNTSYNVVAVLVRSLEPARQLVEKQLCHLFENTIARSPWTLLWPRTGQSPALSRPMALAWTTFSITSREMPLTRSNSAPIQGSQMRLVIGKARCVLGDGYGSALGHAVLHECFGMLPTSSPQSARRLRQPSDYQAECL